MKHITAAERRIYQQVTEAARHPEGFLICSRCDHSIPQGSEERHHVLPRSRGGKTVTANLVVICRHCHMAEHHLTRERDSA